MRHQNNKFVISKRGNVKFILINNYSKQKNLLLKLLNNTFENKNKNYLFTNKSIKENKIFSVQKMESFSFTSIKKIRDQYKWIEHSNIIFDLSDCSKNINKIIDYIKKCDWVWLTQGKVKSENNNLWIIFNINSFSLQNNVQSLEFYNNFYKKVLKGHRYLTSYKPSQPSNNYNNNLYVVNIAGGFKQTKIVSGIFNENYDLWFANNFVDLRSNFISCFLKVDEKSINTKVSQVLNKIFWKENYMQPNKTQIINIKNREIIDKIKLSINNKIIIYLFVEGNDDQLFFNQLKNSFPFMKFKIFTIANTTFSDWIATYIEYDLSDLTTIFIVGIFDHDYEGEKYKTKYKKYFRKSKNHLGRKNIIIIPPTDYAIFTPSKDDDIKLETLLHYHKYGIKDKLDDIKKSKAIKELLYNNTNIFSDTKKLINSYLFCKWVKKIRSLEFVDLNDDDVLHW